jgi:hypothetical protein
MLALTDTGQVMDIAHSKGMRGPTGMGKPVDTTWRDKSLSDRKDTYP